MLFAIPVRMISHDGIHSCFSLVLLYLLFLFDINLTHFSSFFAPFWSNCFSSGLHHLISFSFIFSFCLLFSLLFLIFIRFPYLLPTFSLCPQALSLAVSVGYLCWHCVTCFPPSSPLGQVQCLTRVLSQPSGNHNGFFRRIKISQVPGIR